MGECRYSGQGAKELNNTDGRNDIRWELRFFLIRSSSLREYLYFRKRLFFKIQVSFNEQTKGFPNMLNAAQ
jgi:hypothetical protein